jgi:L-malate glycosyltransferase
MSNGNERKMRVTHINSYVGGNNVHVYLLHALEALGLDQTLVAPSADLSANRGKLREIDRLTIVGITTGRRKGARVYGAARWYYGVRKWLHEHGGRSDLVHAHSIVGNGWPAQKAINDKVMVATVRQTDVHHYMARRRVWAKIGHEVLTRANAIVSLTPAYGWWRINQAVRTGNTEALKRKWVFIPNGLHPSYIQGHLRVGEKSADSEYSLELLWVGTSEPNKNLSAVVQASEWLRQTTPHRVRLHLVGITAADHRAGEAPHVVVHGRLPPASLVRLMDACDVLVAPSKRESFGVVQLEALARGMAVVHSKREGLCGWLPDGLGVIGVNPERISDIGRGILRAAEMGVSERREAAAWARTLSWERVAKDWVRLYEDVCSRRSPTQGLKGASISRPSLSGRQSKPW